MAGRDRSSGEPLSLIDEGVLRGEPAADPQHAGVAVERADWWEPRLRRGRNLALAPAVPGALGLVTALLTERDPALIGMTALAITLGTSGFVGFTRRLGRVRRAKALNVRLLGAAEQKSIELDR